MSESGPPTLSNASVLGPGIAGLFIQGIETGLVLAQFFRWFSARDRNERYVVTAIVISVTVAGLVQSGICFVSAWTVYVQQFGIWPTSPSWGEYAHLIPTLVISVPIQALMIRRCCYFVGKNVYIIVSTSSVVLALSGNESTPNRSSLRSHSCYF
ncbi:hypothetical protein EI94DRAFT_238234 [Lactarius quietus]|nr:hypothetical protein EI94DRAFT_238234 [Lactarius quietus]